MLEISNLNIFLVLEFCSYFFSNMNFIWTATYEYLINHDSSFIVRLHQ